MHAETAEDKKWKIESDLRSLVDAEEVKKDKKRYSAAMKLAKEKMAAMKDIQKGKD